MTISQTNGSAASNHLQNLIVQGHASGTGAQVHEAVANAPLEHLANMLHSPLLGVLLGLHLMVCFCLKCICEKCGKEPGILVWIPGFNLIRLLQAGGSSGWWILLFIVPMLNIIAVIIMWVKVCEARGKSAWLALLAFIPFVNVGFLLYLAFSE